MAVLAAIVGLLVDCIHLEDILASYRREVFERDMALGMHDAFSARERALRTVGDSVVTGSGAPGRFHGRTLGALDPRRRRGLTVLVVKRPGEGDEDVLAPTADTVLQAGDALLVMGRERAVAALLAEAPARPRGRPRRPSAPAVKGSARSVTQVPSGWALLDPSPSPPNLDGFYPPFSQHQREGP